ncbi:hypothetical protein G9A89_014021 [Geosiphon pyriformis]|nr:hypothetical protein G9A89_014021 [Geosiphon pyriformis]
MTKHLPPDYTLPNECLFEIYKCLADDRRSLYKCLSANRTWCKNVVPLLWRETFHYFGERKTLAPVRVPIRPAIVKLVDKYVTFLSLEAKVRLNKAGIPIPLVNYKPTFDYPSFLRKLDTKRLYEAVYEWFFAVTGSIGTGSNSTASNGMLKNAATSSRKNTSVNNSHSSSFLTARVCEDCIRLVVKELGRLFMSRCPAMESLDIHYELFLTEYYAPNEFSATDPHLAFLLNDNGHTSLPLFPGASKCLQQLKEFECGRGRKAGIMFAASKACKNLDKLNVAMFYDQEFPCDREAEAVALVSLIEAQRGLKHFLLGGANYSLPGLDIALMGQRESLTCLDFCDVDMGDVILDAVATLENLERLKFRYCYGFNHRNMRELAKAKFPRLRKLRFFRSYPPFDIIVAMVKNAQSTLKTLCLGSETDKNPQNILVHDPLIRLCSGLIKLELSGVFTPDSLEYFLSNCGAKLESLHMGRCWELNDEHIEVVIEYSKEHRAFKRLNTQYVAKLSRNALINAKRQIPQVIAHADYRLDEVDKRESHRYLLDSEVEVIVID